MRILALALAAVLACAGPPADAGTASAVGDLEPTRAQAEGEAQAPTEAEATAPQARPRLSERYDLDSPLDRFELPGRLDEISGLAFAPDGRLFAHDDERGRVHEIDPATGQVGARFDLGDEPVAADFEGIAIAGDRFFLVTSAGLLYEFRAAADRATTAFRATDTGIGAGCEVEGLEFDPDTDVLLLACKISTPDRGTLVVHRLPLDPERPRLAPIEVPRAGLAAFGLPSDFEPSAVALDPTGALVLVSGSQESILEIDMSGRILDAVRLPRRRHPQPEGIAFGPDGTLYVSDERNGGAARLTRYGPRPSRGAGS